VLHLRVVSAAQRADSTSVFSLIFADRLAVDVEGLDSVRLRVCRPTSSAGHAEHEARVLTARERGVSPCTRVASLAVSATLVVLWCVETLNF
jgi:hypothetical protein